MVAKAAARILIVDDEVQQVEALCATLSAKGYLTTGYHSARRAIAHTTAGEFDLVLTDLSMPEMDGITLLRTLRDIDETLCGVVMTGHGSIDSAVSAMQIGAVNYIQKPFKLAAIQQVIAQALEARQLRLRDRAARRRDRQQLSELEAANQQLEAFAHSVAHDLRTPLHAIDGFCEIFVNQFGNNIAPEGRELLDHVTGAARRMNQLIVDLLAFCQASRQPLNVVTVHTGTLVRQAASTLTAMAPERKVDLRIADLPDCAGDPSLLEQVFVNLLSNAFKFTRDRNPAMVEVGSMVRDGECIYFVRDNGTGFDESRANQLFEVFTRLHRDASIEGTGVGLSIVRNIVERHGGRIWAESAPGAGATFFLTLGANGPGIRVPESASESRVPSCPANAQARRA
jgi:two-component system sensor histidine kinase/response regulator